MSEQELHMISEDRARDEMGATNMLKKHGNMERVVEDYADTIRQLGERSRKFLDDGHPDRYELHYITLRRLPTKFSQLPNLHIIITSPP